MNNTSEIFKIFIQMRKGDDCTWMSDFTNVKETSQAFPPPLQKSYLDLMTYI